MNNQRILLRVLLNRTRQANQTLKKFHLFPNLRHQFPVSYLLNKTVGKSLFLTTLPAEKRQKKSKVKIDKMPSGPLLIRCKAEKFNHYYGMHYSSFEEVPLVSKGWHHKKSKGDFFTIMPMIEHPAFVLSSDLELPKTFEELNIRDEVIQALKNIEVYNPTVIQAKAISKLLLGFNVTITAETGCGKTLAYVIPLIESILKLRNILPLMTNAPYGIILVPSKELAVQVGEVINKLSSSLGLHCVTLVSGDFNEFLKDPFEEFTDIVVSTLGILTRYLQHQLYSTKACKHLILDEADIFFDDEFLPDLSRFLKLANLNFLGLPNAIEAWPNCAQLCLTSATNLNKLSQKVDNVLPVHNLGIISTGYLHKVLFHIRQHFIRIKKSEKPEALLELVKKNVKNKIPTLVFSNRTSSCNFVHHFLTENNIKSALINGNMFSDDRLKGYTDLRNHNIFVLSCTDCMSRGLDMPWVKHIINYEFPNNIASYIHRCGRTGRLGNDDGCQVTNFISGKNEVPFVNEIELAARTGRELNLKLQNVRDNNKKKKRSRRLR